MATAADLEAAYKNHLAGRAPVKSSGQADDAFEVYVLSLMLRAAREELADITFVSRSGIIDPSPLIFRTSPGSIYSTAHDYSHARIEFENLTYEAHIGVYVEGAAGVLHECDVLVLNDIEAAFCRRNRVHPKKASVAVTAECKFYASNLGIDLGRAFLGVTVDLGSHGRFFLSNSDGKSLDRVLAHHKRQRSLKLSPLRLDSELQTVAQFRNMFRDLVARQR